MEKEEFKKRYPKLAEEIELGIGKPDIQFEVEPLNTRRKFAGYDPDVIDFLRRCNHDEEAVEIIEYLKNREEITLEEAEILCKQLEEEGLRSFGSKKEHGFYEQEG